MRKALDIEDINLEDLIAKPRWTISRPWAEQQGVPRDQFSDLQMAYQGILQETRKS